MTTLHVVVIGVSGCGKTSVAERLRDDLGLALAEGDAFHPRANVEKMAAGDALNDADREPWLRSLAAWTRERRDEGRSTVVACSALRRVYRDILREADRETWFLHLHADFEVLRERMRHRAHFMPVSLLQSQFDTLEPLEPDEHGATIDVSVTLEEVVDQAKSLLESLQQGLRGQAPR